jgi:hypothetical protein
MEGFYKKTFFKIKTLLYSTEGKKDEKQLANPETSSHSKKISSQIPKRSHTRSKAAYKT